LAHACGRAFLLRLDPLAGPGTERLIDDVQNGNVNSKNILVYEVSHWGRFRDADKGAYNEQLCKRGGIDGPTAVLIEPLYKQKNRGNLG
jgi:hypothetical protein